MHSEEFARVFDRQMQTCSEMLFKKAEEYATDDERLHNFNVAASIQGSNPVKALGGMMVKHTTSVYDMIQADDPTSYPRELWDEKITDHINYLILLQATLDDAYDRNAVAHPELDLNVDLP